MPGTSQNGRGVQVKCDRGSAMADRPQDDGPGNRRAPPRSSPIGCRWTFVRHCGRMSAQNSGQWPGLQRHGAPVKTQTWSATGGMRSLTGLQTLGTGDPRLTVGHGRMIGQNLSALSCSLQRQTELATFALPG